MKKISLSLTRALLTSLVILILAGRFAFLVWKGLEPESSLELSAEEKKELLSILDKNFPERSKIISPLPYTTVPAELEVSTESVILIDQATGSILYEKNADEEIPPASMTKLVEMFVVYEAVAKGEVSLEDIVPLPPESWSVNLPSDASRMFLGQGQKVTLDELLLGLAIASGNDASIAVANYVCPSMEAFVERMNEVCKNLGLTHTHFVESSGYSEENITTARDFVQFCRVYLERYPESLKKYHSQKMLEYPKEKNLPAGQSISEENPTYTQYNTNKLLKTLAGCDGLKTGFINESGYNLALTAQRFGNRFLCIMMRGPGNGTAEGNLYRIKDGTTLMEFAFSSFADYHAPTGEKAHRFTIGLTGARKKSVALIPALDETFTVPFIASDSPTGAAASVHAIAEVPPVLWGKIKAGEVYGSIHYRLENTELRSIPLVAEKDIEASFLPEPLSFLAYKFITFVFD